MDNIKGILITFVVIGHFLLYARSGVNAQRVLFFIYSFHMPLFVFVSGLFSKNAIASRNYKRVADLLGTFLIIKILLGVSHLLVGQYDYVLTLFNMDDVSWYAFALAIFYLITMALRDYDWKSVLIGAIILACMVGYDKSISTLLSMSRVFVFYPFFYLGFHIDCQNMKSRITSRPLKTIACVLLVLFGVTVFIKIKTLWPLFGLLQGKYPYASIAGVDNYGFAGVLRLAWYLATCGISLCIMIIIPKRKIDIGIGKNTLYIYMFHNPIINIVMHTNLRLIVANNARSMILSGIVLTLVLSLLTDTYKVLRARQGF